MTNERRPFRDKPQRFVASAMFSPLLCSWSTFHSVGDKTPQSSGSWRKTNTSHGVQTSHFFALRKQPLVIFICQAHEKRNAAVSHGSVHRAGSYLALESHRAAGLSKAETLGRASAQQSVEKPRERAD